MRWLSQGSVLKGFLHLLNDIKLFMEKEGRNIRTECDWSFDDLNEELQGNSTADNDVWSAISFNCRTGPLSI
jgi:hypothetical protein